MKILLCCESYFPAGGGVARVNQELAERLVRRGHDVTVASKKIKGRNKFNVNGVKIEEFDASGNLVQGLKGEIERYQKYIVSEKFDALLVYAAQQWTFDALWPVLSGIKARKIHVPCGYSSFYDSSYKKYYGQMPGILKQFDHLIFNASDYRDINFARQCGLQDFSVIPNGASETEFTDCPLPSFREKLGIGENEFIFLTVGSPPSLKGHREVALAYAQIELPFSSVLIMDGKYDALENPLVQTLKIKMLRNLKKMGKKILKRPVFPDHGFAQALDSISKQKTKRYLLTDMPRAEIISAFFSANLFVFASHVEYSPLVLFESAAAGLPFLTIPVGNAAEIVQWTEGGEICTADRDNRGYTMVSPEVLAREMMKLATKQERLSLLGSQGRGNWKGKYTWSEIAKQYEKIILNNSKA